MADGTVKTIDQLPTKQSILGTDYIPLDDGMQSYKVTWAALLALTGGIASWSGSGNTLTVVTKGGQTYTFTPSDSSKQDVLTFDLVPTDGSSNPVTSNGTYDAIHDVSVALAGEASTARTAEGANATAIETNATKAKVLVLTASSVSSLPATVSNQNIESDMVCIHSELSNPAAQTGDWTVTTSSGSLTITGSISGTTNLTMYLMKSR